MLKIACVYKERLRADFAFRAMDTVRWYELACAFARSGCQVDVVVNQDRPLFPESEHVRCVPLTNADWARYDVVKASFHGGFETLEKFGGSDHPYIITGLGSVVGATPEEPGVHFFGVLWEQLCATQRRIARTSRHVAVLTTQSGALWRRDFGNAPDAPLIVPTGVPREIPAPGRNPYTAIPEKIAVVIGNLYRRSYQPEVSWNWQRRLNSLGRELLRKGIRLCLVGPGDVDELDREAVTYLGAVDHERVFDYHYFADVGLVLAQGEQQHNESSRIYYYLRTGLPVVSEAPVPNNALVQVAELGFVVPYDDARAMADRADEAARRTWNKARAVDYVVTHHSWDARARVYLDAIRRAGIGPSQQ